MLWNHTKQSTALLDDQLLNLASIRWQQALRVVCFVVGLVLTVSCRPQYPEVRPARITVLSQLAESDSVSVSPVANARVVGDSVLYALNLSTGKVQMYNVDNGAVISSVGVHQDLLADMYMLLPDSTPDSYSSLWGSGKKLSFQEVSSFHQGRAIAGGKLRVSAFDVLTKDSLIFLSGARIQYAVTDTLGKRKIRHLGFPFIVKTCLTNGQSVVIEASPQLPLNFCPVGIGALVQGGYLWVSAWDWFPISWYEGRSHPGPWVRSAKYTCNGEFTGIVSREASSFTDSSTYYQSDQWLTHGLDTSTFIRVLSNIRGVDVVSSADGSFTRVGLPLGTLHVPDSAEFYNTHPARFRGDHIAVIFHYLSPSQQKRKCYIAVGRLSTTVDRIDWKQVISVSITDELIGLVDTNESPLYRKDLLGIFENPERGPYVARIAVD